MPDLAALEKEYNEAHERFVDDPSDENRETYKNAKQEFADARQAYRRREEQAGNRTGYVVITDEEGE